MTLTPAQKRALTWLNAELRVPPPGLSKFVSLFFKDRPSLVERSWGGRTNGSSLWAYRLTADGIALKAEMEKNNG